MNPTRFNPDEVTDDHRYASLFTPQTADEYLATKSNLAAVGQQNPVTLTADSKLLDGVHRRRALSELRAEHFAQNEASPDPDFDPTKYDMLVEYLPEDADLLGVVIAKNAGRRHMKRNAMTWLADEVSMESTYGGTGRFAADPNKRGMIISVDEAAKRFGVSTRNVKHARSVREKFPELYDAARALGLSPSDAAQCLKLERAHVEEALVEARGEYHDGGKVKGTLRAKASAVARKYEAEAEANARQQALNDAIDSVEKRKVLLVDTNRYPMVKAVGPGDVRLIITEPHRIYKMEQVASFAAHALKPDGDLLVVINPAQLPACVEALLSNDELSWCDMIALEMPSESLPTDGRYTKGSIKLVAWLRRAGAEAPRARPSDWLTSRLPATHSKDAAYGKFSLNLYGIECLLNEFAMPGDVICDPVVTEGATMTAALWHGFQFIAGGYGMEHLEDIYTEASNASGRTFDVVTRRPKEEGQS